MSTDDDLIIETAAGVRTVAINRPQSRNGLTPHTCEQIAAACGDAAVDDAVRCLVITGRGSSFCSGADLASAGRFLRDRSHEDIVRESFHALVRAVVSVPKPVVASIRGGAVGFGFDMALACDLRIASQDSKMGAVFTRIGLVPDGGSSFTLARLVGLARAMEIVLLAETFDGQRAYEMGLVNKVVEDSKLEEVTTQVAQKLAAGPPLAYRLAKANILMGLSGTMDEALEREVHAQVQCLASQDAMEGIQAFFQKRPARFTGK